LKVFYLLVIYLFSCSDILMVCSSKAYPMRHLQYNIATIARHGNNGVWTLSLLSPHHLDSTLSFDHDLVIAMPDGYPHDILHRSLLRT